MNLIAFIPGHTQASERLRQAARDSLTGQGLELFTNREGLLRKLGGPQEERACALLYAENEPDLSFFISQAGRLLDFKLILILPQYGSEILSEGLKLCPRYIGYADNNFTEVTAVLRKILFNCTMAGSGRQGPSRRDLITENRAGKRG